MNAVHPSAVIGDGVRLGEGNTIGPFVVITGDVVIGDDNWIGAGVVIGMPPEVRSFDHPREPGVSSGAGAVLGSNNVIREYVQIHGGSKTPTTIGDSCFIMNQAYVAHDGRVGDNVSIASSVLLAGHVTVGDGSNLGLGAMVHQFRTIGRGAMVGMGAVVTRDIPPFAIAYGSPARVRGANRVGLERRGVSPEVIAAVHAAYENGATELGDASLPAAVREALGLAARP